VLVPFTEIWAQFASLKLPERPCINQLYLNTNICLHLALLACVHLLTSSSVVTCLSRSGIYQIVTSMCEEVVENIKSVLPLVFPAAFLCLAAHWIMRPSGEGNLRGQVPLWTRALILLFSRLSWAINVRSVRDILEPDHCTSTGQHSLAHKYTK